MIKLINVHKSFGPKRVLQGFTLDVPESETVVIIGFSGSGKSVAIKHIVGLLEPDEGEVWVDELEVPRLPRRDLYELRSHIGYVFQFAALFDSYSIGENVAMGLRKQGLLRPDEIEQALGTLPPRDAKVLRLYFGLEGGREHTLEEIGSMLGVTRERVRQLRDRALKRLREGDVGRALGSFAA